MIFNSSFPLISSSEVRKTKQEVISRKKYQAGLIRLSSPRQQVVEKLRTAVPAAAATVEIPSNLKGDSEIPYGVQQMLATIQRWDMVEYLPAPPYYFFDEPKFPAFGALLKEPWRKTPDCVGAFDMGWENAYVRTLGEAIERSCQSHPRTRLNDLQYTSYLEIQDKAFDLAPFFPFSVDSKFKSKLIRKKCYWYPVKKFNSGETKLLPLRLSFLFGCNKDKILDSIRTTNGSAMGRNEKNAIFSGLCELIERDAFFIHYLAKMTPPRLDLGKINDQEIIDIIEYIEKYRLEIHLFNITLEFKLPVIMCIIIDRTGIGPSISIGTKCSQSVIQAIKHSILEAIQIRHFSRMNKLKHDAGINSTNMIKRILDWYDIKNINKLNFFLNSNKCSTLTNYNGSKKGFLNKFKYNIYVSDVSLPDLNGFKAVKVNVPELLPLYFNDDHKPICNDRIMSYFEGRELNQVPHPFL